MSRDPRIFDEVLIARKMRELAELAASRGIPFVAAMASVCELRPVIVRTGKDCNVEDLILELAGVEADREALEAG